MENKKTLEKYYKEYKIIDAVIKEKEKSRIDLFKELNELKAGRFYLTLTDEQKREFRDIYSDSTIIRYHLNEVELEEYKLITIDYQELEVRNKDLENQQKEFIEYINKTIKELECDDVDDEEMKGYLIQRIDTFKEILSKYKEIVGSDK